MASQVRQNFHAETEAGINKQINMELNASYCYQAMAFHFDRDDVALHHFHELFKKQSDEEREHAEKLLKYQNKRGGRIVLQDISKPAKTEWASGLEAMESALEMERQVNQALLDLHALADKHGDKQCTDFLDDFLEEQVESIKTFADQVTNLKRNGSGLGEFLFERMSLS